VFVCLSLFLTILLILLLVIRREMRAEIWYQDVTPDNRATLSFSPDVEAISASSNGNGHHPKVSAAAV
jgi:hypothetical protein